MNQQHAQHRRPSAGCQHAPAAACSPLPSALRPSLLFILLLALCPLLPAQAPRTLAEMEAIYQRELSELHIPLISRYLIELQRQAATAPDKTAWQSEIIRVQQLLKTGGVIDLAAARAALDNVAAPMPPPVSPPLARQVTGAALDLSPALALNVAAPPPDTLPVGQIEWRVEFLAAGAYDIHLQYTCPALPADLPLRVEFGGQTVETTLGPAHVTRDSTTFRVHHLGRITLPADARGQPLVLTTPDKASTALRLKHLFLTPAPASPPK